MPYIGGLASIAHHEPNIDESSPARGAAAVGWSEGVDGRINGHAHLADLVSRQLQRVAEIAGNGKLVAIGIAA